MVRRTRKRTNNFKAIVSRETISVKKIEVSKQGSERVCVFLDEKKVRRKKIAEKEGRYVYI